MASSNYFAGQGEVYCATRNIGGGTDPLAFNKLGNCSLLALSPSALLNLYATAGGQGVSKGVRVGEVPTFRMVLEEITGANLARALYGKETVTAPATITGEVVLARLGLSYPLAQINLLSWTSLTNAAGTVTYVNGTDYTVDLKAGMLTFLASAPFTDLQSLRANYVTLGSVKVGMGTTAPPYLWLRFNGLNTADDNSPVVVDIYKARLYPIDDLQLIADGMSALEVTGRVFYDRSMADTDTDGRMVRIRRRI